MHIKNYFNLSPLVHYPSPTYCSSPNFANETLAHHLEVMHELIQRDKNRPGVIMWSLANEPVTADPVSAPYFR